MLELPRECTRTEQTGEGHDFQGERYFGKMFDWSPKWRREIKDWVDTPSSKNAWSKQVNLHISEGGLKPTGMSSKSMGQKRSVLSLDHVINRKSL